MIDATLENAAAVTVSTNFNTVHSNCIEDELSILSGELVQALLDDMVAVQILNQVNDSAVESINDNADLLGSVNVLDHLLQRPSTVLVESNDRKLARSILNENCALILIAVLQQFLDEIISKWIRHELDDVLVGLHPNHVNMFGVALLKLLLEVSTSMLILAKCVDLPAKRFQGSVRKAVHG